MGKKKSKRLIRMQNKMLLSNTFEWFTSDVTLIVYQLVELNVDETDRSQ